MLIRNWLKTGTNGAYRLKQAVEVLGPDLKGVLFPAEIQKILHVQEISDVGPVACKQIKLQISRDDNKRGIWTYFYVTNPGELLERQTMMSVPDSSYCQSSLICNRTNKLVMAWGIDKSDTDMSCSQRVCNRWKGNSANYVQSVCTAEKCTEIYDNEKASIFHQDHPTGRYLQSLLNDN